MRSGEDHACGELLRMSEIGNARGGNHAGALGLYPGISQSGSQKVGNPYAGFAGILADHDTLRPGGQMMPQRAAHCIDGLFVQGIFPCDSSDSISAKELPQTAFSPTVGC